MNAGLGAADQRQDHASCLCCVAGVGAAADDSRCHRCAQDQAVQACGGSGCVGSRLRKSRLRRRGLGPTGLVALGLSRCSQDLCPGGVCRAPDIVQAGLRNKPLFEQILRADQFAFGLHGGSTGLLKLLHTHWRLYCVELAQPRAGFKHARLRLLQVGDGLVVSKLHQHLTSLHGITFLHQNSVDARGGLACNVGPRHTVNAPAGHHRLNHGALSHTRHVDRLAPLQPRVSGQCDCQQGSDP